MRDYPSKTCKMCDGRGSWPVGDSFIECRTCEGAGDVCSSTVFDYEYDD